MSLSRKYWLFHEVAPWLTVLSVAAFFYPDPEDASALGGAGTEVTENAKRMVQLLARSAYNAVAA